MISSKRDRVLSAVERPCAGILKNLIKNWAFLLQTATYTCIIDSIESFPKKIKYPNSLAEVKPTELKRVIEYGEETVSVDKKKAKIIDQFLATSHNLSYFVTQPLQLN